MGKRNYATVTIFSAVSAALLTLIAFTSYSDKKFTDELLKRKGVNDKITFYFIDPEYIVFKDQISTNKDDNSLNVYNPYNLNKLNFPETYSSIVKAIYPIKTNTRTLELVYANGKITQMNNYGKNIYLPYSNRSYLEQKKTDIGECVKKMEEIDMSE